MERRRTSSWMGRRQRGYSDGMGVVDGVQILVTNMATFVHALGMQGMGGNGSHQIRQLISSERL